MGQVDCGAGEGMSGRVGEGESGKVGEGESQGVGGRTGGSVIETAGRGAGVAPDRERGPAAVLPAHQPESPELVRSAVEALRLDSVPSGLRANELRVEVVADEAGFSSLEGPWRELAGRAAGATVFQSWEWCRAWWSAFGRGRQPYLPVAWEGSHVIGIAPFTRRRLGGMRVLELLGAGRSDYPGFLLDAGRPDVLAALLTAPRARSGSWDVLWLRDMPLDDAGRRGLRDAIRDAGLAGSIRPWDSAPYLELAVSWEEYLARRSANFRSDLKRKRRRLEAAGAVRVERHREPAAIRDAVRAAAEIERHSWKQESGTARMAEASGLRFFLDAASALGAAGKAEVWLLHCGDLPVAFYLNLLERDRVCYYSGTYRREFHEMSPGKVLMAEVIRAACDEGYAVFDFLRGEEAYKATWTDCSRPLYEAFIHSGRLVSRAAAWALGGVALPCKRGPRGQAIVERLQRVRGGRGSQPASSRHGKGEGSDGNRTTGPAH